MAPISYRRHRFPPVVIRHAVWLYRRFTLSYRDVEELLAERGDVRRPPPRPRRRGGGSERKSGSQLTPRRRGQDPNPRAPVREPDVARPPREGPLGS